MTVGDEAVGDLDPDTRPRRGPSSAPGEGV